MKIYYIRHGQTDWNLKHLVQGSTDIPLNDTGRQQARDAQKDVVGKNIDLIIASPLSRARETAEIINEAIGVELILDDRLRERNYGSHEGKPPEIIGTREVWRNELPGAKESLEQVFIRISGFLDDIKERYKGRTILLVTHGGTTTAFCRYFDKNFSLEKNTGIQVFGNCVLKEFEFV